MSDLLSFAVTRRLVQDILEHPGRCSWTLQGLGMLRTYLSKELRLHIWDKRFAVPGVSELHTHPWDFESLVVAGVVRNIRYDRYGPSFSQGLPYMRQTLKCGTGGCLVGEPDLVMLVADAVESYGRGCVYRQASTTIHQSIPENGTVTVVRRTFNEDEDHAYVFWPYETTWVSAEPRPATPEEVHAITRASLEKWFK